MAGLPALQYDFAGFQQVEAAAYSAKIAESGGKPANLGPGSSLGAIFNAHASIALILQAQIAYAVAISRIATIPDNPDGTPNPDLDSFTEQFGIPRLGQQFATFNETIGPPSPSSVPITVPVGFVVGRADSIQAAVIADNTSQYYSAATNVYTLPANQANMLVAVRCLTAGTIGNTSAGTYTNVVLGQNIPQASAMVNVTNATSVQSGSDIETGAQLKARFVLAISEGRVATSNAVAAAILSVSPNLTYSIGDSVDQFGNPKSAFFTVVVNNAGSGVAPSGGLITEVQAAVAPIRALGIGFTVVAPILVPVNIVGTVTFAVNADPTATLAAANTNLASYLDDIGLDPLGNATDASLARAYATVLSTPGVANVTGLTLNGTVGDVSAPFGSQLVAGTMGLHA